MLKIIIFFSFATILVYSMNERILLPNDMTCAALFFGPFSN